MFKTVEIPFYFFRKRLITSRAGMARVESDPPVKLNPTLTHLFEARAVAVAAISESGASEAETMNLHLKDGMVSRFGRLDNGAGAGVDTVGVEMGGVNDGEGANDQEPEWGCELFSKIKGHTCRSSHNFQRAIPVRRPSISPLSRP
ncbi:MAG TPA: hypothetical protein VFD27_02125 [Chthoniobacteraceae bacterium]|nr:hypothetical protein [Chthoniobacteraceae bacterium]